MKYLYIVIILLSTATLASAQNRFGNTDGVSLEQMQNRTYLQFDENSKKIFWAIDLNDFTAPQKTTFQDLVFKNDLLIACSTPDTNNIWYLSSNKTHDINTVILELAKLIDKAQTLTNNTQDKYQ